MAFMQNCKTYDHVSILVLIKKQSQPRPRWEEIFVELLLSSNQLLITQVQ